MVLSVNMGVNAATTTNNSQVMSPTEVEVNEIKEYGNADISLKSVDECYATSVKEEVIIEDIALTLYSTYDNPKYAMAQISVDCADIIKALDDTYDIGEFSNETWIVYEEKSKDFMSNTEFSKLTEQCQKLISFFDIYENSFVNEYLKEEILDKDSIDDLLADEALLSMLPYYVIDDLENEYLIKRDTVDTFASTYAYSSSAAITYAATYAESPNAAYPYYSSDCANFASQILYAGGKSQTAQWYSYKQSGTWYQSYAWKDASGFAYAQGVDNSYSSFSAFSQQISPGNFICFDSTGDGEWDHVGFVTAVGNAYSSSLGYKNFKVAQHTSNYNAWVNSDDNHWDAFIGNVNCELGIIRI